MLKNVLDRSMTTSMRMAVPDRIESVPERCGILSGHPLVRLPKGGFELTRLMLAVCLKGCAGCNSSYQRVKRHDGSGSFLSDAAA